MAKEKTELDFSRKAAVILPKPEKLMPVSMDQWARFMERIKNCGDSSHSYESLGWACVGIAASLALAAITFPASVDFVKRMGASTEANLYAIFTEVACVVLALSSSVLSIFAFRFARQHRNDRNTIRQIIVEDMQAHADRHPLIDDESTQEPASSPKSQF